MNRAAAILATAIALAGCSVHRASDAFRCTTSSDCDDGRACVQGFCVTGANPSNPGCPAVCASCATDGQGNRSCEIACTGTSACDGVACPAGFACTIHCVGVGACGDVDCTAAASCELSCSGDTACGSLRCGATACAVDCSGSRACPEIDCSAACRCDVRCASADACPSMSCPTAGAGACTEPVGALCSSRPDGCDRCFSP